MRKAWRMRLTWVYLPNGHDLVSWLSSLERVEVFGHPVGSLDGERSVMSRSIPIANEYSKLESETDSSTTLPSGMTSGPLTASCGEVELTSSRPDFHASRFRSRENNKQKQTHGTFGPKPSGYFVRYDHKQRCWKMSQGCLPGVTGISDEYSLTWPKAGLMRNGRCWELTTLEPRIEENASGFLLATEIMEGKILRMLPTPCAINVMVPSRVKELQKGILPSRCKGQEYPLSLANIAVAWPTPRASDSGGGGSAKREWKKRNLRDHVRQRNPGSLNPTWVEWLMGWPIGATDLEPLAMDKFQQWLRQHGRF